MDQDRGVDKAIDAHAQTRAQTHTQMQSNVSISQRRASKDFSFIFRVRVVRLFKEMTFL